MSACMDMLPGLGYISLPMAGDSVAEASQRLLLANGKEQIARHSADVARACAGLADCFSLDRDICEAAAYVHDTGGIIAPEDMLAISRQLGWEIDEAEREYPFLLHQRWSAVLAEEYFGLDERIVRAVECHSTLRKNATQYDIAVFLADKLAWDQEGAPPFRDVIMEGLEHSLRRASYLYFQYVLEHKMILRPHRLFLEAWDWLKDSEGL